MALAGVHALARMYRKPHIDVRGGMEVEAKFRVEDARVFDELLAANRFGEHALHAVPAEVPRWSWSATNRSVRSWKCPRATMRKSLILSVMLACLACSSRPPNALRDSEAGVLQREFQQSHAPATNEEYADCDSPYENNTGVTEIAIERTPCYRFCPTYTLRLFSDGRVEYSGQASVRFVGTRRGNLDEYFFARLARAAVGIGFFELKDRYTCGVTDNPTVYVSVAKSGQRKIIEHYAPEHGGPQALRLFEEAIDAVQQHIEWSAK